ncbi:hypothetical protein EUBDOL_02254 [Amedibacillus dolichus DSM 3991]|uniref:Uncharacterized protein n=2 Tax=Amedibacillus dolichus TaxID=31971 RepID=A8RFI8_9FIRM|nr:hypothetical protein EUBDOL_02254 [Amedibacillus dolichus DSM 3991]
MQEYANRKEGVANHYSMKEECLGNRRKEKAENYGMMHIFMLYPKGKYDAKDTSFQNLMNVLFKNEHSVEEKLEILRKQFGIKVTETMEEEVEEMSHICMYYEQVGEKRGMQIGKILTQTANVERLMKKQLSMQEAFELLGIEKDMQEKIIKRITNDEKATNEIKH